MSLPAREIPGEHGLPFIGPLIDRFSYFYSQGELKYFTTRMDKYRSTVFRCNMPPGPFIARDPRVVCLLDALSFQTLFDTSKVEKRDVLDGTFMPSTAFTGGYRTCAYLDPSEPNHAILKGFYLSILAKKHDQFIPLFQQAMSGLFTGLEGDLAAKGSSSFNDLNDVMAFEFVFRLLCGVGPSEAGLGPDGPKSMDLWLFGQLSPLMTLGIKYVPGILEDFFLHNFPIPFFLVRSYYTKIYAAFEKNAGKLLEEAEELGIQRDEACHNLVFLAGFNAYGGMKAVFPALIKWVAAAGVDLHRRLTAEIRAAVKEKGVTPAALNEMALTKSVVYEVLRMEPSVPYQYGRAKKDFEIRNHENSFLIKKGEMLFGYQAMATRDPRIFERPDDFVAERFVGEGEKLLKYVYWSNGRETDEPTVENKQCPGKDLVVMLCRLMLVEFFLRSVVSPSSTPHCASLAAALPVMASLSPRCSAAALRQIHTSFSLFLYLSFSPWICRPSPLLCAVPLPHRLHSLLRATALSQRHHASPSIILSSLSTMIDPSCSTSDTRCWTLDT